MSASTPRQRLGRLFNRRDVNGAANEPAEHGPPPTTPNRENRHVRHKSSLRSLREFVQNTSRSLSRTRQPQKRGPSSIEVEYGDESEVPQIPSVQDALPRIEHQPDLTSDLAHLVLTNEKESRPRMGSVPDQPVLRRKERKLSREDRRASPKAFAGHAIHINTMMEPEDDPYSELVADWNMEHHDTPLVGALADMPAPLKVMKSRSSDLSTGSAGSREMPSQLSHKPDVRDFRRSIERNETVDHSRRRSSTAPGRSIRRSSLDKPLPALPLPLDIHGRGEMYDSWVEREPRRERDYLVKDSKTPPDLKGVVDLRDTEDTDVSTTWSPAVTHEQRVVNTHEVIQHAITREIHNHHIFHRVLPIMDIEVLPARHFVPTENGGLAEVSAEDAPVDNTERLQQLISEAVASMMPKAEAPAGPRQFTARTFEGTEGDYTEYTTPEGFKRTEQWWVHPPEVETGGEQDGQTAPFHLGSEDPGDDGLRDPVPDTIASSSQPPASPSPWGGVMNRKLASPPPTHHTIVPIRMTHGGAPAQQVY